MSMWKYTHIKASEPELLAVRHAGYARQKSAYHFGLEKSQIKNWNNRYNCEKDRILAGLPPEHRGR